MNPFSFIRLVRILYPIVISVVSFALWVAALRAFPTAIPDPVAPAQSLRIDPDSNLNP